MAGYEYNPLLKLDLQKKAATPEDVDRLQEEIDQINEDLSNKVPKFFTSIEEIEIGEIGEYQGETNETFTNGYFYKRLDGGTTPVFTPEYDITLVKYNGVGWIKNHSTEIHSYGDFFITSNELVRTDFESSNNVVEFNIRDDSHDETFVLFLFPFESGIISSIRIENDNLFKVNGVYNNGYLCEYAFDGSYNPCQIKIENGTISVFYLDTWNVVWINGYTTVYTKSLFYGYSFYYDKAIEVIIFDRALFIKSSVLEAKNAFLTMTKLDDNLSQWEPIHEVALLNSVSYQTVPAFLRIDTQPSLDPVDFATADQGAKADTALQQVVHGTDGLYITTTVTQKASNIQTIYTSLTLQDVETADDTHNGVAVAADVRKYLNIITATSEAYGVMWDTENPSPTLTRIGNMTNHALLPVQSQMIGGVMADDGTFTPFDNQADWTQATQARDGSDGQVMVRIPRHWRKCSTYGTYNIVMLSPVEIPGYIEVREQYVSAYEASLQRSTLKLSSVNNATAEYRGGNNEASWDGTYKTLLNRPVTYLNLDEFRTYARNRGNGTKWNCMTYEAVRTIYWLFVTEYATLNSQAEYTSELDANGYHQGGLGIGVSDWNGTAWNNFNGYAPLIPCGILDEYGSGTAVKNFSIYNADTTLAHTFQCNKYRGIEMPFGDLWKYVDGVLINVESGDGVSTAYMTIDTDNFSSTSVANYNEICNTYRIDSYIKGIGFNPNGDIFATQNGANSTSYYCDLYYGSNIPSTTELRAWRLGGSAYNGAYCGLACAHSFIVPGHRSRYIGSRLCFVP